MAKYRFTNKAVEDLSDIWNYTFETWSETQADRYYNVLISFCKAIAGNPSLGKNYEEITPSLFGFRANKHIIFYRIIAEDEVEIVRILHERMDLKNRIRE
ncbi:type II toxin-antitoxin system RelE/ParE family toxin [Pedobacter sp. BS3]|uniref:type II toxin-antitoxin system RelE/ParE family toxin n=1 Tax=Pedobacter sp. BS3 TaxID=2567937 RepID=UPI0011F09A78|nr:type II toxin-antitoxin system RelE/ParE family toxin [Pedobacter sp. BS3]TZF85010.1 type II toxin-antitoxin system RelE/ParE family toxin [Pedobacter sp. BS3]